VGEGVRGGDEEKVFEPFYRGMGSKGSGLGLSIVREIAKKHGGKAYLVKKDGKGTSFALEIPKG
jgi:signal transduction histidine kinase